MVDITIKFQQSYTIKLKNIIIKNMKIRLNSIFIKLFII